MTTTTSTTQDRGNGMNKGEPFYVDNGPVVHFGGCWDGDHDDDPAATIIDCQLDAKGCKEHRYFSPYLLKARQVGGNKIHEQCTAENVTSVVSRCGDMSGLCAKDCGGSGSKAAGGDQDSNNDSENNSGEDSGKVAGGNAGIRGGTTGDVIPSSVEQCNLLQDKSSDTLTVYGACQNIKSGAVVGCSWSADDCADDVEQFVAPAELLKLLLQPQLQVDDAPASSVSVSSVGADAFCDCSEVRTGACDAGSAYGKFCAVSADSCSPSETYIPARMLPSDMDCRLCDAVDVTGDLLRNTIVALGGDLPPASGNTGGGALVDPVRSTLSSSSSSSSSSDDTDAAGSIFNNVNANKSNASCDMIAGGVSAVVAMAIIVTVLCIVRGRRQNRASPDTNNVNRAPVTKDVDESGIEDEATVDEENIN